jgi:hypothetical protein
MAVDTSRERLERLYFSAGERRLWGRTWVGFVSREPNRVIVRSSARSQGTFKTFAAIAAVGLFGIYPAIGNFQHVGVGFPWNDPSTCDGLRYRYEVARDALGAPKAAEARSDFLSAKNSCERHASALPSPTKSVSCSAAIRTYARALRRAEMRERDAVPIAANGTGFAASRRLFRERANDVLGIDEVESDERLGASYFDACTG